MQRLLAVLLLIITAAGNSHTQNVNWRSLRADQQNLFQLDLGHEYGTTVQFGYGRALSWFRPVVVGLDFSSPMGSDLLDDFKIRLGGQVEMLQLDGFSATVRVLSNFRRYENQLVRIVSFGADVALLAGYYTPTWHTAAELGFDKSIVSHLRHSDIMRTNFSLIRDGWFIPSGGHYYYGIQAGKTLGERYTLSLRIGATEAQFDDEDALVPYYVQLGLGMRF